MVDERILFAILDSLDDPVMFVDTGLKYGLLLGLGVGVGMGYGSYAVMPIPYKMAITYFLGTLVKFGVGGIIAGALCKGSES